MPFHYTKGPLAPSGAKPLTPIKVFAKSELDIHQLLSLTLRPAKHKRWGKWKEKKVYIWLWMGQSGDDQLWFKGVRALHAEIMGGGGDWEKDKMVRVSGWKQMVSVSMFVCV